MLVLRMFEMCCDYRNFSEAKAKLLDFQRTLITVSPAHQQTNIRLMQHHWTKIQLAETLNRELYKEPYESSRTGKTLLSQEQGKCGRATCFT